MQALNTSSSVIGACAQEREEVSWLPRRKEATCHNVVTDSLPREELTADVDIVGPVGHERKFFGEVHGI